ncbi:MAG TPA: BBE domain-containing protein, partial [Candidatus Saccharimonadales bacterium]|nr:BBE domain-containing protein [Candidatus Saccharimonadales bacterium]
SNDMLVNDFSDEAIETIAREGLAHDLILQVRSLGGAMSRVDVPATAFAGRKAEVMVVSPTFISPEASPEDIEKSLAPWYTISTFSDGAYVNLLSDATEQANLAVYPEATLHRLQAIKAKYDPENIFNQNHNIIPKEDHEN